MITSQLRRTEWGYSPQSGFTLHSRERDSSSASGFMVVLESIFQKVDRNQGVRSFMLIVIAAVAVS